MNKTPPAQPPLSAPPETPYTMERSRAETGNTEDCPRCRGEGMLGGFMDAVTVCPVCHGSRTKFLPEGTRVSTPWGSGKVETSWWSCFHDTRFYAVELDNPRPGSVFIENEISVESPVASPPQAPAVTRVSNPESGAATATSREQKAPFGIKAGIILPCPVCNKFPDQIEKESVGVALPKTEK